MRNITKTVIGLAVILASGIVAPTGVLAGYGSSPASSGGSSGGSNDAPKCNNEVPGTPTITSVRRISGNQIEIGWGATERASSFTIAYGKEKGKYTYGVSNFGNSDSRSIRIGMLPTGVYYVVLKANNGCMPGNFSPERKMTVFASGQVLGTRTGGATLGKTATPTPVPTGSVTLDNPTATPTQTPTNGGNGGIFQRIWRFIFGK